MTPELPQEQETKLAINLPLLRYQPAAVLRAGPGWGESGYFRVKMTGDANGPCGMYYVSCSRVWRTEGRGFKGLGNRFQDTQIRMYGVMGDAKHHAACTVWVLWLAGVSCSSLCGCS